MKNDKLKFIIFIQALTLFICGLGWGYAKIINKEFTINIPIFMIGMFILTLFVLFIITPIAEWWFDED